MPRRPKRPAVRKRRKPNWGPILWLLVFVNVGAGVLASPLTAVRKVRIVGAPMGERGRLVGLVQTLHGRPSAILNPRALETRIFENRAVENADFRRSLFGSATLTLGYRVPVARIAGTDGQYLDLRGVVFPSPDAPAGLPVLRLHVSMLRPGFAAAGGWPAQGIADLIRKTPKTLVEKLSIDVDSEGAICFNTRQGARIFWGAADRFEEKLRTLNGLLSEKPNLLETVSELNLIEPTRPAWKARPGAKP